MPRDAALIWTACIIGAYLIGSIPVGVIIARSRGVDIFKAGSGNVGATNVGRVLGRGFGRLCFGLDALKGAVPVLITGLITGVLGHGADELTQAQMWLWLAVALATVLGHIASVFLKFRGGKGVATGFGALLAMWPLLTAAALAALFVWYVALRLFRYVSLASIIAAASLPLSCALLSVRTTTTDPWADFVHASPPFIVTGALALLVVYKHRANIGRLRRGEEPKVRRAS